MQRLAKQTVRSIYAEASREKDSETREAIASWAAKSEAKKNRKDMLELAQSERGMQVQPDELDADPWVLNVENGTMDLKSGRLMPHDPKNLLTKLVPVAFDPNAAAPRWEKFLREILPKDRVEFLQRWAGYSLTGDIAEEAFVFLYGTGQNGKSKFVNPIRRILGDYAKTAEKTTFMVKSGGSGIPNNLADLHGVRMIPCMEIPKGQTLNEQLIQNFTGGDPVKARFLFREFFDFMPVGKLWFVGNHPIRVAGDTFSIWRRTLVVSFDFTVPASRRDNRLEEKLMNEAPGILNWCLAGLADYLVNGLNVPGSIRTAVDEYRAVGDPIQRFINERCEYAVGGRCPRSLLYDEYSDWCSCEGVSPVTPDRFGKDMVKYGIEDGGQGRFEGKNVRWWDGIQVKSIADIAKSVVAA